MSQPCVRICSGGAQTYWRVKPSEGLLCHSPRTWTQIPGSIHIFSWYKADIEFQKGLITSKFFCLPTKRLKKTTVCMYSKLQNSKYTHFGKLVSQNQWQNSLILAQDASPLNATTDHNNRVQVSSKHVICSHYVLHYTPCAMMQFLLFKWILHQVSNFDQNFFDYALSHFLKNPKRFYLQVSCSVSKTVRKPEAGCIHTDKPFKMCPSCHFPSKTQANTHTDTLFKTNGLLLLVSISYWTIFFLILS